MNVDMKILIDGDIYLRAKFGGSIRYCNQLIDGLIKNKIAVDLLLPSQTTKLFNIKSKYFQIINKIDESIKYDIFHASYYSDFKKMNSKKTIITVHDMIDELLPDNLILCSSSSDCIAKKAHAINFADHIIAISNTTKSDLIKIYKIPDDKISVIYHGVENIFLSENQNTIPKEKPPFDEPYILHVGGREGYKNFEFLLKAYAESKISKEVLLVVVGSQDYFLLNEKRILQQYNLQDKVILTGYVSEELLKRMYTHAKLVVLPSLYEGFGYPMIESLACGATVACSSAPALIEIGQGVPLVFNPNDILSCIKILEIGFFEDHSQRNQLGKKLISSLTIDNMIKSYIAVYKM